MYELISFIVALITAIGVYLGPQLADRKRAHRERRYAHLEDLKKHVFEPLLKFLRDFQRGLIRNATESHLLLYPLETSERHLKPNWIRNLESSTNHELLADLPNHFPTFAQKMESFRTTLNEEPRYLKLWLELAESVDRKIKAQRMADLFGERSPSYAEIVIRILLEVPPDNWPNFYNRLSGLSPELKSQHEQLLRELKDDEEILRKRNALIELNDRFEKESGFLVNELEKIILSRKELHGKCRFV